jgi:hypothetical protein
MDACLLKNPPGEMSGEDDVIITNLVMAFPELSATHEDTVST